MQTRNRHRRRLDASFEEQDPEEYHYQESANGADSPQRQKDHEFDPVKNAIGSIPMFFERVASRTAPQFSLAFVALFFLMTYLHESHFTPTAVLSVGWVVLQLCFRWSRGEFSDGMFWTAVNLLGNLAGYLFIGTLWSMAKLYIEASQGRITFADVGTPDTAEIQAGAVEFIVAYRPMITKWIISWPMSALYTLSKDPLRIAVDTIITKSTQRYAAILLAASARGPITVLTGRDMLHYGSYAACYMIIGIAWTFPKLYWDVRNQHLSRYVEEQIKREYQAAPAVRVNYFGVITALRWSVVKWVITWPLSIVYTITRDPLRLLGDFLQHHFGRIYQRIINKALDERFQKDHAE